MRSLALWRAAGLAVLLAVVAVIPLDNNVVLTQVGVLVLMFVGAALGAFGYLVPLLLGSLRAEPSPHVGDLPGSVPVSGTG